ncbi:MAG: ABC transporter permease subunit [Verrucomicrobia bacterium]|nr:ABC transporter permease subunit [Verrucomicrobiota bacterium]
MKDYFLRRLLLIPPTLLGITLLVFTITRFVPGGPGERMLQQAARSASQGGKHTASSQSQGSLSEEQQEEIEEQFGLDQPILVGYAQWLGVLPRASDLSKGEFGVRDDDAIGSTADPDHTATLVLRGDGRLVRVTREGANLTAVFAASGQPIAAAGWKIRLESPAERQARFARRHSDGAEPPAYAPRAVAFKTRFSGLVQGDLGRSTSYGEAVDRMIFSRMPIAIYFGLLTAIITYAVCLPLGVLKALKHRTFVDTSSSVLIFLGYSIPGFALGAILLVQFGVRLHWFPLFGLTSPGFDQLDTWSQLKDLAAHTVLPLLCYVIGSFAMLTMLTKNNLMDNLAADYVRTAVAKGASFRRAVFGHAFRNSMIPVATSLGSLLEIFIGGSLLVETVFDIQGFGLLQYQAVIARDVPVIMGTLVIEAFLMLLGHVLSDLIVAMVDPRIKFE